MTTPQTTRQHPVFLAELDAISFIEASAGTGKTWTLSGLYLRALLERQLRVEQVVVATFTKAAAAALKHKIEERIQLAVLGLAAVIAGAPMPSNVLQDPFLADYLPSIEPSALESSLARLDLALSSTDQMQVSTLNSLFQQWLLRGFGNTPFFDDVELVDDQNALMRTVIDEFLQKKSESPVFAKWFAYQSAVFKASAKGADLSLLTESLKLAMMPSRYTGHSSHQLLTQFEIAVAQCRQYTSADWLDLFRHTAKQPSVNRRSIKENSFNGWVSLIDSLLMSDGFDSDKKTLEALERAAWLHKKMFEGKPVPEPIPQIVLMARQLFEAYSFMHTMPLAVAYECRQFGLPRLAQLTQQRRIASFDDQVNSLHQGLFDPINGPQRAQQLRKLFPLVMVDETQDTDKTMWEILFQIYGSGGLVAVGDPKQSIYGFRGADLNAYLQAKVKAKQQLSLSENQRSSESLITAVNRLFSAPDSFVYPGITMPQSTRGEKPFHPLHSQTAKGGFCFHYFLNPDDSGDRKLNKVNCSQLANQWCIEQVHYWLKQRYADESFVKSGDIAIIVNTNAQASKIKRALSLAGINAVEASRARVIDSDEADELLRILGASMALDQTGAVMSAMTTRIWGLQTAQLSGAEQLVQIEQARALLVQLQRDWVSKGAYAGLNHFVWALNGYWRLGSLIDGDRRVTNVVHLLDILCSDPAASQSITAAWSWLSRVKSVSGNSEDAQVSELRLESDANLVQIQTIHKSKGLEYPVVLMPYAWDVRQDRFANKKAIQAVDPDTGESFLDFDFPSESPDPRVVQKEVAEGARNLYVALTRASHVCSPLLFDTKYDVAAATKDDHDLGILVKRHYTGAYPSSLIELTKQLIDRHSDCLAWQLWQPTGIVEAQQPAAVKIEQVKQQLLVLHEKRQKQNNFPNKKTWNAAWLVSSFTAMANRNAAQTLQNGNIAIKDHDHPIFDVAPTHNSTPDTTGALLAGVRSDFPQGAIQRSQAGVFLHEAFENVVFNQGFSPDALSTLTQRYQLSDDTKQLCQWFNQVLHAPLSFLGGASLAQVDPAAVFNELDFLLYTDTAATQLGKTVSACLQDIYGQPTAFDDQVLLPKGFIEGFIDSVFCHHNKWYLLDWKSNSLGKETAGYEFAGLTQAMQRKQYGLQAIVYSLALHRWLRANLQDYQYESHFGSVGYLFVRAVGVDPLRPDLGVWHWRPTAQMMNQLDQGFGL